MYRHFSAHPGERSRTVFAMSDGGMAIDCFICQKHALGDDVPGGVLYDDGLIYAGHTHPLSSDDAALGYLMVEPRRHAARLGDLTDEEAAGVGVVANRL